MEVRKKGAGLLKQCIPNGVQRDCGPALGNEGPIGSNPGGMRTVESTLGLLEAAGLRGTVAELGPWSASQRRNHSRLPWQHVDDEPGCSGRDLEEGRLHNAGPSLRGYRHAEIARSS